MFYIPTEIATCWVVWLRQETSSTALPAVHQVAIWLRACPIPALHLTLPLQGLSCIPTTQGKCHILGIMCVWDSLLSVPWGLGTEHLLDVLGPAVLLDEVSICAFQDLCNLTPTPISPMLHTFCPAGNQDIGQSQHWQSWKYDVTKTAFVFRKVGPRLWTWGYTVSSHAEQFAFSIVSRPTKNLAKNSKSRSVVDLYISFRQTL